MDNNVTIFSEIFYGRNRRESIRHRLKAPNLAFAVMDRLYKPYRGIIGEKSRVTGFLVSRNNRYYIEMPPKELLGYYPEIIHPLSLLVSFELEPPPVGTLSSFKGVVKARHDRISKIRKNSQIFGEKYLEIDEWEDDYKEVYAECPLELKDIIGMVREQLNPEPPLDLALLYSPISSPPIFNTMGGVSSILSGIDFERSELTQIGQFLYNLVPPWHHRQATRGFHLALYPELTPKVSMMLQHRKNSDLEFSPLITRVKQIDLDKERGFFHFDDPLVLNSSMVAYDETYREIDEYRPEIQWSLMWAHLQLQEVDKSQFPDNFDNQYDKWVGQMCEEFNFFKSLHILDPASLYDIRGRRGGIIRLAAAYGRLKEIPLNDYAISKTFDIARQLFADFDTAHGYKLLEYEGDTSSPFYGLSKSQKLRAFREAIFDLVLSQGDITRDQMKKEAEKYGLTRKQFNKVFSEMCNEGVLFDSGGGKFRAFNKRK